MSNVTNPKWPRFEGMEPEMFQHLDRVGFAVISGIEPPEEGIKLAIAEFRETGIPNDLVCRHIGMRFLALDTARQAADLPRIESDRVEVYANRGFDGSGNPHKDQPFRDGVRSIEVINGTREWNIEVDEGQHVVIEAKPGDILLLRNKGEESCRAAKEKSLRHSFTPGDVESMSLVYARVVPNLYWLLSKLKNRPSKFQSASVLMQKYKNGINHDN